MKLKEALDKLPRRQLVRIGTRGGTGFLYAGYADKVPWADLNKAHSCWMNADELKAYIPLEKRDVIEEYPSLLNPAELFIIDGVESTLEKEKDLMIPDTLKSLSDLGCENLAGAIYKQTANDLIGLYLTLKKHREEYLAALQGVTKLERFIREDALMVLKEPESLIEQCRKEVFGDRMV